SFSTQSTHCGHSRIVRNSRMHWMRKTLTIGLFLGAALWRTGESYVGIRFFLTFPVFFDPPTWLDQALQVVTIVGLLAVLLAVVFRSYHRRKLEWQTPTLFIITLALVEASWRFYIHPYFLPEVPGFKLAAVWIMHILPVVAVMGLGAAYLEWKHAMSLIREPKEHMAHSY
ncbi:hypothetical protein, partial [Sphingosinicella rhizophila]